MNKNLIKLYRHALLVQKEDSRCLIKSGRRRSSSWRYWKGNRVQLWHGFQWYVMKNGSFSFRNSLCAYGGKWNLPRQIFKEGCRFSAWFTDFQGCALPKQNSKQQSKSSVLACWWCPVNKEQGLAIGKMSKYQGLVCAWESWPGLSGLQRHYTSTKNTAGPCLVHRVVQGWSSAKIPTESKDKVILGKVSFIFTALIWAQFLKTLLYLQNPTSRIHSYPIDLLQN